MSSRSRRRLQYEEPDLANLALEPVNVRDGMTIVRRGELVDERFAAPNVAKMLGRSRFEQPVDLGPYVAEIRKKAAALLVLLDEIRTAWTRKSLRRRGGLGSPAHVPPELDKSVATRE